MYMNAQVRAGLPEACDRFRGDIALAEPDVAQRGQVLQIAFRLKVSKCWARDCAQVLVGRDGI